MISISTTTFDLDGTRIFHTLAKDPISTGTRRVSRTRTLDGGVSIYDGGYAHGDRDIEIEVDPYATADREFCEYILQNYTEVNASTPDGVFLCAPVSVGTRSTKLTFKLYIKEKIS